MRRQTAVDTERPEVEGPWLKPPPATPPRTDGDPEEPEWLRSASVGLESENQQRRDAAIEKRAREVVQSEAALASKRQRC